MVSISVNNQYLYIPADTALSLEQRNAAFDPDNFGADVVWTFDIPAAPNSLILEGAQFVCRANYRRYACQFDLDGIPVAYGYLYVQQVNDQTTLSCGAVLDGLNAEFGSLKLSENDYGDDIAISQESDDLETHRTNWRQFLLSSLNASSVFKFFLFYDPDFYSDNDDFGYFRGLSSALENSGATNIVTHLVNRLFSDSNGNLIENAALDSDGNINQQGCRIFNERCADGTPCNGYTFAPALSLVWLLRKVFAQAGFALSGTFLRDKRVANLFVQSLNALDGDLQQLGVTEHLYIAEGATGDDDFSSTLETRLDVGIGQGEHTYKGFRINGGDTAPAFNWSFIFDTDQLQSSILVTTNLSPFTNRQQGLFLLCRTVEAAEAGRYTAAAVYRSMVDSSVASSRDFIYGDLPSVTDFTSPTNGLRFVLLDTNGCYWIDSNGVGVFPTLSDQSPLPDPFLRSHNDVYLIQLTSSLGNTVPREETQDADIIGNFTANALKVLDRSKQWVVELAVFNIDTVQHGTWNNSWDSVTTPMAVSWQSYAGQVKVCAQAYGQLERLTYVESVTKTELSNTNTLLNIFDRALRWKQHVPDITNAEFIRTLCKTFGLALFTDPLAHTVQLDFFKDVLEAGAVDLSDYVTNSQRLTFDPKTYEVRLTPLLPTSKVADDYLLDAIGTADELPAPRSNKKKSVFIENELAYRTSTHDTETDKYEWQQLHGDDRPLTVGDGSTKVEETVDVKVGAMHLCDGSRTAKLLPYIHATGCSKLMDEDWTGSFGLILQQYLGAKNVTLQTTSDLGKPFVRTAKVEYASPVALDMQGNLITENSLALSAVGDRSIGKLFLEPYYRFMAAAENYRFTLRIPTAKFFAVRQLLLPQSGTPTSQVRWILINSQRYLPSLITYEFSAADTIVVTIECSRPHQEL